MASASARPSPRPLRRGASTLGAEPSGQPGNPSYTPSMERRIVGFHQDERQDWVADLECGHTQHVRHNPPWTLRPWVVTPEGRAEFLGRVLDCVKCDAEPG